MPPQPGTPQPSTVPVCSPASPLVSRPLLCPGVMETETLSDCPVCFLGVYKGPPSPGSDAAPALPSAPQPSSGSLLQHKGFLI